jgi:hypothetical protein
MTDQKEVDGTEQAEPNMEYVEYAGDSQYGTEFLTSHTITPRQAKEGQWGIDIPTPLVWTKRLGGAYKGRMLVPVEDITPEALAALENEPGFSRVTLDQ